MLRRLAAAVAVLLGRKVAVSHEGGARIEVLIMRPTMSSPDVAELVARALRDAQRIGAPSNMPN